MNKQTRSGKAVQTYTDGCLKARRRLAESMRDVMTIIASATLVSHAHAADTYSAGRYLQLSKGHDVTTEGGYYESTGQGPMFSAIRITGPNAKIHIFDSTLVGLYWDTHALYARRGGVADAHDSTFLAKALDGSAVVAEDSMFKIERSKVETLGYNGHGVYVTGNAGILEFSGGEIVTRKDGASAARSAHKGTLQFTENFEKEGVRDSAVTQGGNESRPDTDAGVGWGPATTRRRILRTRLITEGGEAPAVFVETNGTVQGRGVELETRGPNSPAVRIDSGGQAAFWSSTFKVAAGNTPIVSMRNGAGLALRDLTLDTGEREVPVIVAQGGGQVVTLTNGAQLVGRTLLTLDALGETPGELMFLMTDTAAAVGEIRIAPTSRLQMVLFEGGRFEGRVTGPVNFKIGLNGAVALVESTQIYSMVLRGRMQFARSVAPQRTITVKEALDGAGGTVVLRTLANSGGLLAAQKTDRLLVEGDALGEARIDVETTGTGGLTDTNSDHVNQANEGISLVQVAGKATATSFSLSSGYVAVGPYRYELAAYGPGTSDEAQRVVSGTDGFWDYRLVSFDPVPPPKPEPVVVAPPPAPEPEPVVVAPPSPVPEPVIVEPPQPPVPEPVIVEPPQPPVPEPVIVEPPQPPVPEPVIVEPPQPPVPEPVIVEPPQPPVPEPVIVEPPQPPVPEPGVVEPPPPPAPEPAIVEPPPVPAPVIVEPLPPPPAPAPEVVKPIPVPARETAPPIPKPATTLRRQVLVPQASAYVAMPLAASGFLREALHSWGHPHANPAGHARHLSRESERGFAQVFGSRGRYQASGQERAYRPDFSTRQYGAQFGLPVHRYRTANGVTQIDLGAGAGDAGFTIDAPFSQSHSRIRIGGLGLRVANTHSSGAYATALLKIDHLGIDVRTQERNEVASFGGIGISALCEAGGAAAFGNGWTVESSVRASYVEVRLRNFIDADQVSVKPQPFRSASAGIASRVSRSFTAAGLAMRPYVGAGLAYTSGPPSSQRIGGVPFASETMSSSWEASAGFEGRLGKNARLLVDVAVQDGLDHGFSSVFATGAVHWAF